MSDTAVKLGLRDVVIEHRPDGAILLRNPDPLGAYPVRFTESVGYALSATLLGLMVAVVALVGNGYLQRRIDKHAARLDVLLERMLALHGAARPATPPATTPVSRV